jgi:phosphorylase kinase alpha/beta subunit
MLEKSYAILDKLRMPHGLYLASPSEDYSFVWLRDSFYEVLPYLDKDCDRYEKTYHRFLNLFKEYEWKLDIHTKQKPIEQWEYIHAKYDAHTVREVDQPWGHAQHDSVGAILFGIGEGERVGKKIIRDDKDKQIVQKIVNYLYCCNYWIDSDNGIWEEDREIHSSSVGAVIQGLQSVRDIVYVPRELITRGYYTLGNMFSRESANKEVDLAQLTLVYPFKVYVGIDAETIVKNVENKLLKKRGVIRYESDSYYSSLENEFGRHMGRSFYIGSEAEWTMGLPFLSLCHFELGNYDKAEYYIKRTEEVMLEDGSLPELYYSNSDKYNGNTPLGWSNALYIIAKEKMNKLF